MNILWPIQFVSANPNEAAFWGGILLIIGSTGWWWSFRSRDKKEHAFRQYLSNIAADSGWRYEDHGQGGWILQGKLGEHACKIIRKQGNEAGARVILKLPHFEIKQDRFMLLSVATRKTWTNALLKGMLQSMADVINKRIPGADKVITDMLTFAKDGLPAGNLEENTAKKWTLLTKSPNGQYLSLSQKTQELIMEFDGDALRMEWGQSGIVWMYDIAYVTGQDIERLQALAKSFAQDCAPILSRLR